MFNVGDRVVLSDYGMDEYDDTDMNPHDCMGTVYENYGGDEEGYCVRVEWDFTGSKNSYRYIDLELITPTKTTDRKGGFKRFASSKL